MCALLRTCRGRTLYLTWLIMRKELLLLPEVTLTTLPSLPSRVRYLRLHTKLLYLIQCFLRYFGCKNKFRTFQHYPWLFLSIYSCGSNWSFSYLFTAVLLIGEPTHWESHLQLLVDLLLTEGVPNTSHAPKSVANVTQLPVIACNMDLVFMHQACMPRFGHGAFLVCLEALYKVCTSVKNSFSKNLLC